MEPEKEIILTELELDTLQELMNISFGQATADLAEIVDIFIELTSPKVESISAEKILEHMREMIPNFEKCSIVEQHYYGEIQGIAVLVFPEGSDRELLTLFQDKTTQGMENDTLVELEKEVIMEVGNILIGACLGNLFKTLKSSTTYLPPWTNTGGVFKNVFLSETMKKGDTAITMETVFTFEDRNISGYLFVINSNSSMGKIQNALAEYWKQYNVL